MSSTEEKLAATVEALIPKSLDDIIRSARDRVSIRLANEQEIAALAAPIYTDHTKGDIDDWYLITITLIEHDKEHRMLFLIGQNGDQNWMTSLLTGIHLEAGLVTTKSGSVYRLIGPAGQGEPSAHLLVHICAVLHEWGLGQRWGVPAFFY